MENVCATRDPNSKPLTWVSQTLWKLDQRDKDKNCWHNDKNFTATHVYQQLIENSLVMNIFKYLNWQGIK